jgi:predicted TIM-barrel fold metal-dependent hydrolase
VDAHVHLHPERLAGAIERWFAAHGWVNAHSFEPAAVADTLRARHVRRFCFFSYAHRPGMSRELNRWLATTAAALPDAIALGTLHPDDPDLDAVAAEATGDLGLRGFKFHHSVQKFHVDDPRLFGVYERAEAAGHVFMLHVGTMPYRDPFTGVERFQRLMARFPRLRVCVAHMGAFQSAEFLALLPRYPHLYVDTTMAMTAHATPYTGADPAAVTDADLVRHQDRVLFGSDFPLIPYDYDLERRWAWERGLGDDVRRKIFHDNALRFFALD